MKKQLQNEFQDKDFFELLHKGGVSFLMRIGGQIIGFFVTLLIAHHFGAKGLGEYMLAVLILRIFSLFAKLGLDTVAIRFFSAYAKQKKWKSLMNLKTKLTITLLITSFFASISMYYLSGFIAELFGINYKFIRFFSFLIVPMVFFIFHYSGLRGLKEITAYTFFYRISHALFTIISIIILLQFNNFSEIPFYAFAIGLIIASILSFITLRRYLIVKTYQNLEEVIERKTLKSILIIALPLMFAQSVQLIISWTDKLMLGALDSPAIVQGTLSSAEQVGIYGVAFKLSMFASIALMSINSIASPKFSEMYAENNFEGLKKITKESSKLIFWFTIPLVIFFFLFPSFFLGIFGKEFIIGANAFVILSIGMLVSALSGSVGNLLQMTGNHVAFMNILFIGAIMNIVLNYFLIPLYGLTGAAVASTFSIIIWNLGMVLVVKRRFGFLTFYNPFNRE